MKALILVGGFGTRLRPLTISVPKPLVEFGDKPILCHQLEALSKVGVNEVILAVSHEQTEQMKEMLKKYEQEFKLRITISVENEPMGTAGPLRLAKEYCLNDNPSGLLFVFNSDVTCDYPLTKMIEFHKSHGKEGTILVTNVEDPTRYGVIVSKSNGQIERFVEKPQVFVSNKINAGLYLFNTSVIDRIPMKPTSIEREIFPKMAEEGALYQMALDGFWMDIGQPKDYLIGQNLYLQYLTKEGQLKTSRNIKENVMIHPTAKVDETAIIGPNVVIGENCEIGPGSRIINSTILPRTTVQGFCYIEGSIIGWSNNIGQWTRIQGLTVTAEDVQIKGELFINGIMVLPHKQIAVSQPNPGNIIM